MVDEKADRDKKKAKKTDTHTHIRQLPVKVGQQTTSMTVVIAFS